MGVEAPLPFTEFVLKGTSRCDLQPHFKDGKFVGGCDYVPEAEAAQTNAHGCYEYATDESWREQPKWMSFEVATQVARRIGEHALRHALPHVRIIGHGGELLMASPQWLDKFSSIVTTEIQAASPQTTPYFSVTTNGLSLTEEKIDVLRTHGYQVSLSLDGDRVANDRHRRDRQGRSIYDRVVRAATMLRESGLTWGILPVIDTRNDPRTVLNSLASHKPHRITPLLPHANHSVAPQADPKEYGAWLNEAFKWYLEQKEEGFIAMPDFDSLMVVLLGGASMREAIGGRPSQELFFLPNGACQRVDTIKSAEPGAVATGMDVFRHSIDDVAERDPGIIARRLGERALAEECHTCPLLKPCGGGNYPHRFKAGERRLRMDDPVQRFVDAFQHPTAYCDAQKEHIPFVAGLLEQDLAAPAGTLRSVLSVPERLPVYTAPAGYEIGLPEEGDEFDITAVHAAAYVAAYVGVSKGATPDNLEVFVSDATPDVGFYDRKLREWGSLVANKQPDPEAKHVVLVAREQKTGKIVGFASGRIPQVTYLSQGSPMDSPKDTITAVYVHPDHQRQGVGMAVATAVLQNMGPQAVTTTTSGTSAVAFFERLGFEQRPRWLNGVAPRAFPSGIWLPQLAMYLPANRYWAQSLASSNTWPAVSVSSRWSVPTQDRP